MAAEDGNCHSSQGGSMTSALRKAPDWSASVRADSQHQPTPLLRRNTATMQRIGSGKEPAIEERRKTAWEKCGPLANAPSILDVFVAELASQGVVGEERAAKLTYLVLTSRLLDRPISAAIKAPSSSGKSYLAHRVLSFFPTSAAYQLSAMSQKALAYSQEPVRHRTIVVAEASGLADGLGAYLMRSLISENRINYETVVIGAQGPEAKHIIREGPTNLFVTTTAFQLDPELETRLLSIPIDDGPDQTKAVMLAHADLRANPQASAVPDLSPWIALQEWLTLGELRVVVPYARQLADAIPPVALRLRRDVPMILGLIETHAILHQVTRERDAQGRIIATLDDYATVRELVADLLSDSLGVTVTQAIRATVEAVRGLSKKFPSGVPLGPLAQALDVDKSTASRRAARAAELGHLRNLEEKAGRPSRLVTDDPLPDKVEMILPPPEALGRPVAPLQSCG